MRWISFCMLFTSVAPTLGSRAAWVSRSSSIFLDQRMARRSASSQSARIRSFSSLSRAMAASCSRASASLALRRATKVCSRALVSSTRRSLRRRCWAVSSLMRVMSRCMASTERSSCSSSRCSEENWPSILRRFWLRMVSRAPRSCMRADLVSMLRSTPTSWVCPWIHWRCISSDSLPLSTISSWSSRMVASRGPICSSSSCLALAASSPAFSLRPSSLRVNWFTCCSFLLISSLRRLISWSYFAMSASLALRSALCSSRRSRSSALAASVWSASTRTRARRFSSAAVAISASAMAV
mmetsp:Transcript_10563/g.35833  ORF Transcript_10563/g.35833 Transcript_10563/m.35833 type:complete len:297 (-) Transcript_10563:868-1758(-)